MSEMVFGQEVSLSMKAARRVRKSLNCGDEHEAFVTILGEADPFRSSDVDSNGNGNGHSVGLAKKPSKTPVTCRRQSRPAFGRFHA